MTIDLLALKKNQWMPTEVLIEKGSARVPNAGIADFYAGF